MSAVFHLLGHGAHVILHSYFEQVERDKKIKELIEHERSGKKIITIQGKGFVIYRNLPFYENNQVYQKLQSPIKKPIKPKREIKQDFQTWVSYIMIAFILIVVFMILFK